MAGLAVWVLLVAASLTGAAAGEPAATPTPAPTPVPPFGSLSPFPTTLITPPPSVVPPELGSDAAILEDLDSGQVLFEKASRARRPIASLTKVMTALLVLEKAETSETVTVGADATSQGGSRLGLEVGEERTVNELLYALLLQSANDAAVALADHVAGTEPAFVEMMNRRVADLGLRDTSFQSATGLDDDGYSTARDMALLDRLALGNPTFAKIVRTKFRDIPAPSGPARHIQNRNVLLWLYPGAIGVKTGFTTPAGHCMVAAASQGPIRFLAVTLGAPLEPFDDAAALLNYGFDDFQKVTLVVSGSTVGTVQVEGLPVVGVAADEIIRLVRSDLIGTIEREFHPADALVLPIPAGGRIGSEVVLVGGRPVGSSPVLAAQSVRARRPPSPSAAPPPPSALAADPLAASAGVIEALLRALAATFL
jgi:D-alanyl-D-alanine carboxypeptidase (penicillin-binding protein 5/6)